MSDTLLVAIIAAGSALLGSAVAQLGPLLQHRLSTGHERRVVRRQKYERMAMLCGEVRMRAVSHRPTQETPATFHPQATELLAAIEEMSMLATLYFPQFVPAAQSLRKAAIEACLAAAERDATAVQASAALLGTAMKDALAQLRQLADQYT